MTKSTLKLKQYAQESREIVNYLVVIDTNVIVSALLSRHSDASTVQVIEALLDDQFTPIYNDEILSEYDDVLHRKKFHFPESTIQVYIPFSECTLHGHLEQGFRQLSASFPVC